MRPEGGGGAVGTVGGALTAAAARFREAGIPTPDLDAEVLLAAASGTSRASVLAERRRALDPAASARFAALVERRCRREPVAYLVGEREFWSLPLAVDRRVLVPRPETETAVEQALGILRRPGGAHRRVADVGTGSGAIALALASEATAAGSIVAIDRSAPALAVAAGNARRLAGRLRADVALLRCDLLAAITPGSLDLVVSNPPYLTDAELAAMEPELFFEPREALAGGDSDGLGVVRSLVVEARRALRAGGWLVSEIGAGQGGAAAAVATAAGFEEVAVARDLAERDRVLVARRPADTLEVGPARGAEEP